MANNPAPALGLREGDDVELEAIARSRTMSSGVVRRARIVSLASQGIANQQIAELVGVSVPTVLLWRGRYLEDGLDGLMDRPKSGRPRVIDERRVIAKTLDPPPKKYGVTHWSSRLLGAHLGIGNATVARIWRDHGIKPWRAETFKFSTDPQLEGKVRDVVGLYMAPPTDAVVLCIDEKTQIQALDRTAPLLPMRMGVAEKRTHDYVRHGTTTLFAALEVATGRVTASTKKAHTRVEFLAFLKQVAKAYPEEDLHVVMDNYATHKTQEVREWLDANPRIHIHFTPTSASWMNLVEIFFGIIDRQAIRRGTFGSVRELNKRIRAFITGWNNRCHPFTWTKTADQILTHAKPKTTSNTRH